MSEGGDHLPMQTIEVKIDPWEDRRNPFIKMCRELAAQTDRFTNGDDPDTDRSSAVRSLAAVTQFISEAVPTAPQLCHAIVQLGIALADLDAGGMPPMLHVARSLGRGKRPSADEMRYAVASAYITLRIEDGCSLTKAARETQSLFVTYAAPLPGKTVTALRDWRKRIGQRGKTDPIKIVYREMLAKARQSAQALGGNPADHLWSVLHGEIAKPAVSKIEF